MFAFAEFEFVRGGAAACLVVGVVAGLLTGVLVRGGGPGVLGDVFVGLMGAAVGLLVGLFVTGTTDSIGAFLAAFLGACVLIVVLRLRPCRRNVPSQRTDETVPN